MSEPGIDRGLSLAGMQMSQGNYLQAIETLKGVLTIDPDHGEAHALLSICLLSCRRAHAAMHEARLGLAADPQSPLGHYAMGQALLGKRKLDEAEREFSTLLELEPEDPENHRAMARLLELRGRRAEAEERLDRALELDPENPTTLAMLGESRLNRGDVDGADRLASEALQLQPDHIQALVLRGSVALRRGDVSTAREHAVWALRQNAEDVGALHLMVALKTRANRFLGLWWRYATWMGSLGDGRSIVVLLGAFVVYQLATIWVHGQGYPEMANIIQLAWLGICIYTWVGPGLFERSLRREIEGVTLEHDF